MASTRERFFLVGIWGTCMIPVCWLAAVFVVVPLTGLAFLLPLLDFVFFPLLGFFIVLVIYGWPSIRKRTV